MRKIFYLAILFVVFSGVFLVSLLSGGGINPELIPVALFSNDLSSTSLNKYGHEDVRDLAKEKLSYKFFDADGVIIYKFPKTNVDINYYHNSSFQSLKDFSIKKNLYLAINGGYFLKDFSHAGLFVLEGKTVVKLASLDKQINGVVSKRSGKIMIESLEQIKSYDNLDFAFQTGPIFVKEGRVLDQDINQSLNGKGEYNRSFFGLDNESIYIGYSSKKIILNKLGEIIVQNIDSSDLVVINLDGGSSTSFFSAESSNDSFRTSKQLPFILGVILKQ
ncbi:hypothetical protein D6810_02645 [Candidatus Dojkabacteria bacterium]|uniref:Phosphodiester glycosidase domain-containing protein n=1 Tax=Candidatus Dojkabacteria bacterium TaxID=2099670 RepID=A0A3M0YZY9_9BACT|nr:MAG: hypothetical protein D6810_02645 [Candidatus Dojkabacteria bacterium]